jgi:UDP-N-acetylglucosamine/UDP-N-acetylgalactosamine diphosphorylase
MSENAASLRARFEKAGQGHLFAFWETLDAEARARLVAQVEEIDLEEIDHLVETLVRSEEGGSLSLEGGQWGRPNVS